MICETEGCGASIPDGDDHCEGCEWSAMEDFLEKSHDQSGELVYREGGDVEFKGTRIKQGHGYKFRDHAGEAQEGIFDDYHLRVLSTGRTWILQEVTDIQEVF